MDQTLAAILLGILEGFTEFLPISSTGHLILATELFGYDADEWKVFNVVIQLGAVMAVVVQYWRTFWGVGLGLLKLESSSLLFVRNIALGFLPAAILGLLFKEHINVLLGSPIVVGWALVMGGIAIILIERSVKPGPPTSIAELPARQVIGVGLFQCMAMVPGVSRSGATIMGSLLMGIERKTAAEFSFFLAVPTMLGATVLQLYTYRDLLGAEGGQTGGWTEIALGFTAAFVVALISIRALIGLLSRTGFTPFGYYRIVLGTIAIAWLTLR